MKFEKPSVTADIIVQENESVLLIKRKREPYRGMWALPGGFLDVGKETVKKAAQRELKEETGLVVKLEDLNLIGESSNPERDPRGHIVSLHYSATKYSGEPKANDDAEDAKFFPINNIPVLAFDHAEILDRYLGGQK